MKSAGAGGISVFKNIRKVKYCKISKRSNKAPIHDPTLRALPIDEKMTPAAATAPTATPTIKN